MVRRLFLLRCCCPYCKLIGAKTDTGRQSWNFQMREYEKGIFFFSIVFSDYVFTRLQTNGLTGLPGNDMTSFVALKHCMPH